MAASPWNTASHSPSVDILICGSRNDHTVRYALNQSNAALAVLTHAHGILPDVGQNAASREEELAAALGWSSPVFGSRVGAVRRGVDAINDHGNGCTWASRSGPPAKELPSSTRPYTSFGT